MMHWSNAMKTILISDEDAATVKAILLTHAEMQDNRSIESLEVIGRLRRDDPKDAAETIADLQDTHNTLEEDCENLKRISHLF
jgi:hypothetical protein